MNRSAFGNHLLALVLLGGCAGSADYVPPGPAVPVQFLAAAQGETKPYSLTVRNEKESWKCEVPCALQVSSGTTDIDVTGPATFQTRVVIPPVPAVATLREPRLGQWLAGTTIGTIFALAGASADLAGGIYDGQKQYGQAALSYGVSAGLWGVAVVGSIVALTAGKSRVTVERSRTALRSLPDGTARGLALSWSP